MTNEYCYFTIYIECGGCMFGNIIENKSNFDLTEKSTFSNENQSFTTRSVNALVAQNRVPNSHRRLADNYMVIKKVFNFQMNTGRISNVDKTMLEKYDFNTLEFTTVQQMYNELELLQQWAVSDNKQLASDANEIFAIRIRELKFLEGSSYADISNEIYNGYKALIQYLREISKFRSNISIF